MPLTHIVISIFAIQAIRYLLFDKGLFDFIWKRVSNIPLINKFLNCPFCQAFWVGLAVFLPQVKPLLAIGWGLASAWIAQIISLKYKSTKLNNIELEDSDFADEISLLECNIDDMSGEFFGDVMNRLFAVGAIDVWFTSVYGKKNRPLYQLSAIVRPEDEDNAIREILTHSSTAGVRKRSVKRIVMDRSFIKINIMGENIAVKKLKWKDVIKFTPEWEDCAKASDKLGKTISEIYSKAQSAAMIADTTESQK